MANCLLKMIDLTIRVRNTSLKYIILKHIRRKGRRTIVIIIRRDLHELSGILVIGVFHDRIRSPKNVNINFSRTQKRHKRITFLFYTFVLAIR